MARRRSETVSIFACTGSVACLALFEWLQAFHRPLLRQRAEIIRHFLLASEGTGLLSSSGRLHQMALRRSEAVSIFACTGSAACLALFKWLQAFHRQLLRRRADNAKRSLLASEGNSLLSSSGRLHQMAQTHSSCMHVCSHRDHRMVSSIQQTMSEKACRYCRPRSAR